MKSESEQFTCKNAVSNYNHHLNDHLAKYFVALTLIRITQCKLGITVSPFYKIIPDTEGPKVRVWEVGHRPLVHHDVHTTLLN